MLSRYPRFTLIFLIVFFIFLWSRYDLGVQTAESREPWVSSSSSKLSPDAEPFDQNFSPDSHHSRLPRPSDAEEILSNKLSSSKPADPKVLADEEIYPTYEYTAVDQPEPDDPEPDEPSPFAYVFYATDNAYACSVLVNIHRLQHEFHTPHRIFVLATLGVSDDFIDAMKAANATVSMQEPPPLALDDVPYYRGCLLKMLGFKMHKIESSLKRVLVLDADQMIMQSLDHVFDLPDVDIAAPRAYWIAKDFMTSAFMLISLSDRLWDRVNTALKNITPHRYDMDLVNDLLGQTVLMLPGNYATLNTHWEAWNLPPWYRPEIFETEEAETADDTETEDPATKWNKWDLMNADGEPHEAMGEHDQAKDEKQEHTAQTNEKRHRRRQLKMDKTTEHGDSSEENQESSKPEDSSEPTPTDPSAATTPSTSASSTSSSSSSSSTSTSTSTSASSTSTSTDSKKPAATEANKPSDSKDSKDSKDSQDAKPDDKPEDPPKPPPPAKDKTHPNYEALFTLYHNATQVLHFSALGKPWSYDLDYVKFKRPNRHPMLEEQWRLWRQTAIDVCPPIRTVSSSGRKSEYKLINWV